MNEEQILAQFGKAGWRVIGRVPITRTVSTPGFGSQPPLTEERPTGQYRWILAGPNGESDEMTVRPVEGGPNRGDVGYEVIAPPKKDPPKGSASTNPAAGSRRIVQAGGQWVQQIAVDDKGTWSVEVGPDGKPLARPVDTAATVQRPQLVNGRNGELWSWDGATLTPLKGADPDKAREPTLIQGVRGELSVWDGTTLTRLRAPEPEKRQTQLVEDGKGGKNLIDQTTGEVVKNYPVGTKYENITGYGYTAINPDGSYEVVIPERKDPTIVRDERGNPYLWDQATNTYKPAPGMPGAGTKQPNLVQGGDGQWYQWDAATGGFTLSSVPGQQATATSGMETVRDPATGRPIGLRDPRTGSMIALPEPGDTGAKLAGLQAQARAERDRLLKLRDTGALSDTDASKQFDAYWQTTIEPQKAQLAQDQARDLETQRIADDTRLRQNATAEGSYEQSRQAFAQDAGESAVDDVLKTLPFRVGPNFGANFAKGLETLSSGGGAVRFDASDFTYDMPNVAEISQQATARALAGMSPYAALLAGQRTAPAPVGVDVNTALQQSRYGLPPGSAFRPAGVSTGGPPPLPAWPAWGSQGPALLPAGLAGTASDPRSSGRGTGGSPAEIVEAAIRASRP